MQQLQHTQFIKWNEQALLPIGDRFAPMGKLYAAASKNNDIERPWFERYEA